MQPSFRACPRGFKCRHLENCGYSSLPALREMKEAEGAVKKRASRVWNAAFESEEEIDRLFIEIDGLVNAYEGCTEDLKDLNLMRHALRLYQSAYRQLSDPRLSWPEFQAQAARSQEEASGILGHYEIPWLPDTTIADFVEVISRARKEASTAWITTMESEASGVATMSAVEANRLHDRAYSPQQSSPNSMPDGWRSC